MRGSASAILSSRVSRDIKLPGLSDADLDIILLEVQRLDHGGRKTDRKAMSHLVTFMGRSDHHRLPATICPPGSLLTALFSPGRAPRRLRSSLRKVIWPLAVTGSILITGQT